MDESRRSFLKTAGASVLGLGCLSGLGSALARAAQGDPTAKPMSAALAGSRWAMLIDTRKCLDQGYCAACMNACHAVHSVPRIEEPRHEVKWIWKETYKDAFPNQVHEYTEETLRDKPVLVMCNHCENPPCVKVCPTQATWKREDGLVMMDMHRCVGCRYCMAACPYGSRSFNWKDPRDHVARPATDFPTRTKGVVEKCNFCAERLARGMGPACVEACQKTGANALMFGDIKAPGSELAHILRTRHALQRKPNLGTAPHVFYLV